MKLQMCGYIALLEAVVHQAERDLLNIKRKGRDYEYWGKDAEVFFASSYYENIQEILHMWHGRGKEIPHVSYVLEN